MFLPKLSGTESIYFLPQVMKCLHVTGVYHFHEMIDMLVKCGYKKGTTLFGYGYDFRQSVRYFFMFNHVTTFLRLSLVFWCYN